MKDEGAEKTKSNVCERNCGTNCTCSGERLEQNTWEDEGRNSRSSDEIIDSWTWGEQPTITELTEAVHSLMGEQLELISEASKSTPSSTRLHQRLLILERYYIAYISSSRIFFGFDAANKDGEKNTDRKEKNYV